jgi:adenine-specific DNA-methyltransferase
MVPVNLWKYEEVGTTDSANKELSQLMGHKVFDFPKPVNLVKRMIQIAALEKDSIVLDFFSGSATTAHAVMQLNAEDGGDRSFIMVQMPEQTDECSEAYKTGYKNICEIGKARIHRAGEKIKADMPVHSEGLDIGFKVFKLYSTNLKIWDNTPSDNELEVTKRIQESVLYLVDDRKDIDVVYEIMLKFGLPPTLPVQEVTLKGTTGYIVLNPEYKVFVCLQSNITIESVVAMLADLPFVSTFIFADRCFSDYNTLISTQELLKKSERKMRLF